MVNQTLSAITRPSTSDAEEWKEDINHTIRQMCEEYGLNYHTTIGEMYAELEKLGGVNLSVRQKNLQARIRRGGAVWAAAPPAYGGLAQSAEQAAHNGPVPGSSPRSPTSRKAIKRFSLKSTTERRHIP